MKTHRALSVILLAAWLSACNLPVATATPASETALLAPAEIQASPTPANTPTAIAAATTMPLNISIAAGDMALADGDYNLARTEYRLAYNASGAPLTRAASLWGLARVDYESGKYPLALAELRELLYYYADSQQAANAQFLMGETLAGLGRHEEAAAHYSRYLALKPGLLDAYAQERMGDSLYAVGNYTSAILAYQAALAAPHLGEAFPLQVKLAQSFAKSGDAVTAQAMYADIGNRAEAIYLKAQMDLLSGQLYLEQGAPDQGYAKLLHAVNNYPDAYDSYTALVTLVDAGVAVDDYERGLVDYFAGQYGFAVDAFQRYIALNPGHNGSPLYYMGLALRAQGDIQGSIEQWNLFIDAYPANPFWLDAWEDKAYTLWAYSGKYEAAAQTLLDYVATVPGGDSAAYELMSAARIQERDDRLVKAAATWQRVADEYPNSTLVPQALFWEGITLYRLNDMQNALLAFHRSLLVSGTPEDQARAQLWVGKTQQALGSSAEAQASFQQAAALDPSGYYSERARDILLQRPMFEPPPSYNLNFDLLAEQQDAEAWIRLTFNLPAETDLSRIGDLGQDARLVRGTELWRLGLYDEARLEFEDLRQAVNQDPANSYRLANYLFDLGMYRVAINAARQVLALAGLSTQAESLTAPNYFNHVRYGPYYKEIVLPAAQQDGLNPLFLFAVMRQESLFEGFVRSSAGARGLMQIMPDTGQTIVDSYGWPPEYQADDLYRPVVSINLGAYHLMTNSLYFDGNLPASLAAYNAGLGSAILWVPLAPSDPDLFVEVVRFQETRDYLRGIYENFVVYRNLYGTIP